MNENINKKELFNIGEVAGLFDINKKTLRYYDQIDLFKPSYIDQTNNYRYYTANQFENLNTIIYLRSLGISLSEIKLQLENRDISNTINLFEVKEREIEEQIKELKQVQIKIKNRINKLKDSIDYQNLNEIVELALEERTVFVLRERIKTDKDLELSIRKLENKANKTSSIFLGEVGVSISKENLKNKLFAEYDSLFIFSEDNACNQDLTKVLPRGKYVCVRYNGLHKGANAHYNKLLSYIDENKYEILEDSIEITLVDSGLTNNPSEFVTEIQILVESY